MYNGYVKILSYTPKIVKIQLIYIKIRVKASAM